MSVLQNFRSAFNGFNREDVVKYIEYINAKHAALVNQLTSETEFLKEKLNAMSAAPAVSEAQKQAEAERDTLKQQVAQLEERILMLELELEEAKAAKPAPEAPKPAVPSQPSITAELEFYRRAERIERQARERAEQICRATNGALGDATALVDEAAQNIGALADRVSEQLALLQSAVAGSKQALRSAADTMYAVRPDEE